MRMFSLSIFLKDGITGAALCDIVALFVIDVTVSSVKIV